MVSSSASLDVYPRSTPVSVYSPSEESDSYAAIVANNVRWKFKLLMVGLRFFWAGISMRGSVLVDKRTLRNENDTLRYRE